MLLAIKNNEKRKEKIVRTFGVWTQECRGANYRLLQTTQNFGWVSVCCPLVADIKSSHQPPNFTSG